MSDVEFETDMDSNPRYAPRPSSGGASSPFGSSPFVGQNIQYGSQQSRGMTGWLVKHGIVSGDNGAKTVLVGIVCVNFVAAALILYFFVLR